MEQECIICLEELINDIVVLSCPHKNHYHYKCLQEWINTNNTFTKICTICDENVEILNIINEIPEKPISKLFSCCVIL
jgi:hypothetical protein